MPDARTRDLQRQAQTGDAHAHGRLLRARRRAGELSTERLKLAAVVGSEAARVALGRPQGKASPDGWLKRLASKLDRPTRIRVAIAGANACIGWWNPDLEPASPPPRKNLHDWVHGHQRFWITGCWCARRRGPEERTLVEPWSPIRGLRLVEAGLFVRNRTERGNLRSWIEDEQYNLREFLSLKGRKRDMYCLAGIARSVLAAYATHLGRPRQALRAMQEARLVVGPRKVSEQLKADLIPWLLGEGDPVRERVLENA